MRMLDALRVNDKKGLFDTKGINLLGFPTGIAPFDFYNGYKVHIRDENDNYIASWNNIGIFNGSFSTFVGESGTGKTTFCLQSSAHIVKNIEDSGILFFDVEGSANLSRIRQLTGFTHEEFESKFEWIANTSYIEDVFEIINQYGKWKIQANKNEKRDDGSKRFEYVSNKLDEFGKPIVCLAPTFIVIDSLPLLVTKDSEEEEGMLGNTYAMRVTKMINQFYQRLRPVSLAANLVVMIINHVKDKIETSMFTRTQNDFMYLKGNKTMPGGKAPKFLAHNVFQFITADKYTVDDKDGFNGFKIKCQMVKSRTNIGNRYCTMVFDSNIGFDPWRSLISHLKEVDELDGRNPYVFIKGHDDMKFNTKNIHELCNDPEFRHKLIQYSLPILEKLLSKSELKEGEVEKEYEG